MTGPIDLLLEPEALNSCVQCGLCLPHCPTYRVTGEEALSPRGRIKLMREVQDRGAPVTDDVRRSFGTCVQCRGCESACPSAVPFGHLIEQTRASLVREGISRSLLMRFALKVLEYPRLLRLGTSALAIVNRMKLIPKRLGLPAHLPIWQQTLPATGQDVFLFTGCVMDAWQRDVHAAGARVLAAAGFGVTPTNALVPCCGALHAHAGLTEEARRLAEKAIRGLSVDDRPILVDSAGCGASMKDFGRMLETEEAKAFSKRVFDIGEWVANHIDRLPEVAPLDLSVAIQDPCHLRHVQRVHESTRAVLSPFVSSLIELDDDGLCCGAGGAFMVLEPALAGSIRDRKCASIGRSGADVIASANPGCSMHLANAGVKMMHPMELIDRAIDAARR